METRSASSGTTILSQGRAGLGGGVLVAPSILSADFAQMGDDCEHVITAGGDVLHIDVMDGHFAPNLTMGPDMVRWLRQRLPNAILDVHLMVTDPGAFIEPFARAGADHLSFHVEVVSENQGLELLAKARDLGCSAGVAVNPGTDFGSSLRLIRASEMIVVMGVMPGFSGQKLIPESLNTVRAIRREIGSDLPELKDGGLIEFDGGATRSNASELIEAGVDVVVGGSSVFGCGRDERSRAILDLRGS